MPIIEAISRIGSDLGRCISDLLFPPRCIVCRRLGTWLCAKCVPQLPRVVDPVCRRCGAPLQFEQLCSRCQQTPPRLARVRSVYLHQGPVRTAIHRLKYRNGRALALVLGGSMAHWWSAHGTAADLIVPVPLHPTRLRQRGYNQAALLARQLGRQCRIPVRENALVRVRPTPSQMTLDAEARRTNVTGAFRCTDRRLEGKQILLVDDVCTTGATLDACACALKAAGAATVQALTLARAA